MIGIWMLFVSMLLVVPAAYYLNGASKIWAVAVLGTIALIGGCFSGKAIADYMEEW